jgi:subtilisin family serine protease
MQQRPAYASAFTRALQFVTLPFSIAEVSREWAWGGSDGGGVKVAVIDSGIDDSHPAVGRPVTGYVAIAEGPDGQLEYDTGRHEDLYGHGTACASIIRAAAPECELYSVRVLGANLGGRATVFAAGLRWAIENGMHVCNLSLGTTKKDYYAMLHELADLAYFRNVALVTAANNMRLPSFPSVYPSVISVASHESKDPYLFLYNPNPPAEFGAPGIDVRVAWLNGQWITATGNSYAAPHIAGIVAKILGKHPGLTLIQIKTILQHLSGNIVRQPQTVSSVP